MFCLQTKMQMQTEVADLRGAPNLVQFVESWLYNDSK